MAPPISILIHYTHKETLGHTTRVQAICHALARTDANVHVLQGGLPQPFMKFPSGTRTYAIPHPFDSRASFKGRSTNTSQEERSRFILETARRIQPDIFVTEFFPFGRLEYLPELYPTLRYLRARGTRLLASIGYPYIIHLQGIADKTTPSLILPLLGLYDKILIHTPEKLENSYVRSALNGESLQTCYDLFFKTIEKKIIYTGYVRPAPGRCPVAVLPKNHKTFHIVISRGGGAVYPKIIAHAIRAHKLLGNKYSMTIASGPSTSAEEMKLFQACLTDADRSRIALFPHIPGFSRLLDSCQASVSMCGYNTSVQLLASRTQSVIVPYINDNSKEPANDQQSRALLLKDHRNSTILSYNSLSPEVLAETIREKCENPVCLPKIPANWFNGARLTASILTQ